MKRVNRYFFLALCSQFLICVAATVNAQQPQPNIQDNKSQSKTAEFKTRTEWT